MRAPAADPLLRLIDEAVAGRAAALEDWLVRGSRLPGLRPNETLVAAFAQACRARGAKADRVALALARQDAERAPGASALEFLPMCGIAAIGARAATDESARSELVAELHAHADDLRFRVRDAVVQALGAVGAVTGSALAADVGPWMDGYFHAAAVLTAMAREPWLGALHDASPVVARLGEAFVLARDAPRAAARYPGRKALVEVLAPSAAVLATRFGAPVLDCVGGWAKTKDPELRGVVAEVLDDKRLRTRLAIEVGRVRAALEASGPPVRNPDHDVGRTRDRSGARRGGHRRA
jgi:hypothetical protein